MFYFILFFLIIISSVLESAFLQLNLVILFIISISLILNRPKNLIIIFFTGLIYDLLLGYILGTSSIIFLLLSLLIGLYQRKYYRKNLVYLFFFSILSVLVMTKIRGLSYGFFKYILNALLIYPVYFLSSYLLLIFNKKANIELKLP